MFEENNLNGRESNTQENEVSQSGTSHYYYGSVDNQPVKYVAPVNAVSAPQTSAPVETKKRKGFGAGKLIAVFAIVIVLSVVLGGVSGFLVADKFSENTGNSVQGGNVVIYESVNSDSSSQILDSNVTITEIAKKVAPSVVEITTEIVQNGYFASTIKQGAGSGVIISEDGYIVTNHHVIDGAKTINVILNNGKSYAATLIGTDEQTDIAVLKIEASGLIPATFGKSGDLEVGDFALAVGNPLGKLGGTVTNGIISALEREVEVDGIVMTLMQTNAAVNPGNSGGGLFNSYGELIGIVNLKVADEDVEGIGFAIPIDVAKVVIRDLVESGYVTGRVMAGVNMLDVLDEMTAWQYRVSEFGPYIYNVEKGSDAEKAGIKVGDLVLKVDGETVNDSADIKAKIQACSVGDTLTFTVKRDGKTLDIMITFTEYKPN